MALRPPPFPERDEAQGVRPVAIALHYEGAQDDAPRVAAKGEGPIAEQIIALAREHGIEIKQDADLASLLAAVPVDAPIPIEAYVAVAEILSYIYRRRGSAGPSGS